jgi:hypothetical protein
MDISPDQKCNRCKVLIDGDPYSIFYTKDYEVKEIVCEPCVKNEVIDDYNKTKHISTKLMMEATLAKYYLEETDCSRIRDSSLRFFIKNKKSLLEVANTVKEVETLITEFEDKHWIPYLRKDWNDSSNRGHSVEITDIKVLMWGSAGRVLITLENKEGSVTMIFSDYVPKKEDFFPASRGGVQGFSTNKDNALMMLKAVLDTDRLEFKDDKDVHLLGT